MPAETLLRVLVPLALAGFAAVGCDVVMGRRGVLPPGFANAWRRAAGVSLLAGILYVAAFASLGALGVDVDLDLSTLRPWQLFSLHALLVVSLVAWGALAWAGTAADRGDALRRALYGFRLAAERPLAEIGLGLFAGVAIWGAVIVALVGVAAAVMALGGADLLPQGPPGLVSFLVAQPAWLRLAGALSAGLVEETFFRGFLQPRVGIALSSLVFVLAHASYGEPFMLVGVAMLSLVYGLLARWRGNVWAAVAAHALFDAVQLLVVVPWAVEHIETATPVAAWLAALW